MSDYLKFLIPPDDQDVYSWAEENYYLSPESSAYPGKFHAYPYQKEILRCMTPGLEKANGKRIWRLTLLKSSRIGYNKMLMACVGFHIHRRPSNILIVEPTEDDCKELSKEEIGPLIRDTSVLHGIISDSPTTDGKSKLLHRMFKGGVISLGSAKTPNSFRRISRKIIITDEVDAYPPSSGKEGSPSELAIRRSQDYFDRICIEGSTPAGTTKDSVIYLSYMESDQRKYYVECPKCGHKQPLDWKQMWWKDDDYSSVVHRCKKCDYGIEYKYQRDMVENGEWRIENLNGTEGHVGFYINSLYSCSPNLTWSNLVAEYDRAKGDENRLRVFTNTVLGLPFEEKDNVQLDAGDILDHLDESYRLGEVPQDVCLLTGSIDIQGDKIVLSVWGFGAEERMWLIFHSEIYGDPTEKHIWEQAKSLFTSPWGKDKMRVRLVAIDSGYQSEVVANIAHESRLFRPIKGSGNIEAAIIRKQTAARPSANKAKIFKRDQLYLVGVNRVKSIIHKKLVKMVKDNSDTIHFPIDLPSTFAEELTSETQVKEGKLYRWKNLSSRHNEALDLTVYAYAMMILVVRQYNSKNVWDRLMKNRTKEMNVEKVVIEDKPKLNQQPQQVGFNRFNRPFSRRF